MIDSAQIFNSVCDKLIDKYYIYKASLHEKENSFFFLMNDRNKKLFAEVSYTDDFILDDQVIDTIRFSFNDNFLFAGVFNTSRENSKKIAQLFPGHIPRGMNKRISCGFGDRIGIATSIHSQVSKEYNFFPLFAQQSVREITMTGKVCEDVLHSAVVGAFQSGFTGIWGADADHIRDEKWLKTMVGNSYFPYTMFTLDTYAYIIPDTEILSEDIENDNNFKKRLARAKKYIGKSYDFSGYRFIYDEDKVRLIVRKYYRSLDFLLNCFKIIKQKIKDFDFEPTFDERDIDTLPEDHFFLASEMIDDGITFTTFAPKFPGVFEKGIDYIGDVSNFIQQLKAHRDISKYFGGYRLSLHSADDKFRLFKVFRDILGENFHVKTSGTTWMESLRTIAQSNADLFKSILDVTLEKAVENSKAYYIKLDYSRINDLFKAKDLVELIDIKESRQLLHVSYGTVLNKYRKDIIEALLANEGQYEKNVSQNYRRHFSDLFN